MKKAASRTEGDAFGEFLDLTSGFNAKKNTNCRKNNLISCGMAYYI
jgi:hypothetical protein